MRIGQTRLIRRAADSPTLWLTALFRLEHSSAFLNASVSSPEGSNCSSWSTMPPTSLLIVANVVVICEIAADDAGA